MSGPLHDVRVLDVTQMLAGPIAAMRLGDLGADVIKVEAPGNGEFNRTHGFDDMRVGGEMTTFVALNRNKRSVALDLKSSEGRQALLDLAATSDVLIQNFRVGTAERLGIGPEDLAAVNPALVYCSISGYGPTGPYRDRPGQDLVVQGYSGSMFSVGSDGDPPVPGAIWAADTMSGYQAAIGVLAALHHARATGEGQTVEIDMLTVVLDTQIQEYVTHLNTGWLPKRSKEPSAHVAIGAPYGVYETADGWLTLAMAHLPSLGDALNDDWLKSLTEYNDGQVHRDEIYRRIRPRFVEKKTLEWIEALDLVGVWAGPVYDYADVVNDPHVQATGTIVNQPHRGSSIKTIRPPVVLSRTPATVAAEAPELGAHTEMLLREIGYTDQQLAAILPQEHQPKGDL